MFFSLLTTEVIGIKFQRSTAGQTPGCGGRACQAETRRAGAALPLSEHRWSSGDRGPELDALSSGVPWAGQGDRKGHISMYAGHGAGSEPTWEQTGSSKAVTVPWTLPFKLVPVMLRFGGGCRSKRRTLSHILHSIFPIQ